MKRFTISLIAIAFFAIGCGDDSPSSPSAANNFVFTADLRTSNEVPPITNAESTGSGNATVNMTVTRDASNAITGATAEFIANFSGFPANTPIILSHIHLGPAGVNGNVLVNSGLSAAAPVTLTNGSGSFTRSNLAVTPEIAQGIINNPAGFYFNSHTTLNPGGVVRGQLVVVR